MEINVGDIVETCVYIGCERIPMSSGRVVALHSGYCDVDVCYPFGAPWIHMEKTSSLRVIKPVDTSTECETGDNIDTIG